MGLQSRVDDERVGRETKTKMAVDNAVQGEQAKFEEAAYRANQREQARTEALYQQSQKAARDAKFQGRREGVAVASGRNLQPQLNAETGQRMVQEGRNQVVDEAAMAEEKALREEQRLNKMIEKLAAMKGAQPGMQEEGDFAPNPNIPPEMAPQMQPNIPANQLNNGKFVPNPQEANPLTEYAKMLAMDDGQQQSQ